ncbi:hypothetical protein PGT21_024954 [Puccinia graminis f. sp. tritici]|uniref:Uncharacterized protein n=1 Tax=Puccinia graminis f. sp. tritici TaxID=56615 RepID=A0A5B0ND52_PUCGR|nr:hypothetical protein PGT21_024954 [Puccinia graminis f. sp. tritici]KAA1113781.1 hypothetical protein PGTUg99_019921 [Puccinia graminis f. sp. tritici]
MILDLTQNSQSAVKLGCVDGKPSVGLDCRRTSPMRSVSRAMDPAEIRLSSNTSKSDINDHHQVKLGLRDTRADGWPC